MAALDRALSSVQKPVDCSKPALHVDQRADRHGLRFARPRLRTTSPPIIFRRYPALGGANPGAALDGSIHHSATTGRNHVAIRASAQLTHHVATGQCAPVQQTEA